MRIPTISLSTHRQLLLIVLIMTISTVIILPEPASAGHHHHLFHHLGHRRKIEMAKKIGAALFIAAKNKKFILPLPLPLPLPVPIFKTYQPVIHDPLFFKHQMIKQHIGGHIGGLGGIGGIGGLGGIGGHVGGFG